MSGKITRRRTRFVGAAVLGAALYAVPASAASASGHNHPTINVGGFPTGISLDPVTNTIYVGNGSTEDVSLINGATCDGQNGKGCGQKIAAVTAGTDPIGSAVDPTTNTLYVANARSGTVAVINARVCDAANTSGCRRSPATVRVGVNDEFLAIDPNTHTIYVANINSNTVSVIDAGACNAGDRAGCSRGPVATIHLGPDPFAIAVDAATDSVYVTEGGANFVSVIDGKTCNATNTSGCNRPAARVHVGVTPGGVAVDALTDTIYVTAETSNNVSVINGKTCNATVTTGCSSTPVTVKAGNGARGVAINETTDTLYVANSGADTVSVINAARCDASVHSGCGQTPATVRVGSSPRRIAIDERTNTIYVTNADADTVSVIAGATCNGTAHTGC